ncbi:hypothetical protein GE09DRAFT_1064826 [Coniochaeta sp. 2T2.1]|nr:hypothetical protein GE09DRAFT_1064826 [Coniochaeta sp. 2T2.1]
MDYLRNFVQTATASVKAVCETTINILLPEETTPITPKPQAPADVEIMEIPAEFLNTRAAPDPTNPDDIETFLFVHDFKKAFLEPNTTGSKSRQALGSPRAATPVVKGKIVKPKYYRPPTGAPPGYNYRVQRGCRTLRDIRVAPGSVWIKRRERQHEIAGRKGKSRMKREAKTSFGWDPRPRLDQPSPLREMWTPDMIIDKHENPRFIDPWEVVPGEGAEYMSSHSASPYMNEDNPVRWDLLEFDPQKILREVYDSEIKALEQDGSPPSPPQEVSGAEVDSSTSPTRKRKTDDDDITDDRASKKQRTSSDQEAGKDGSMPRVAKLPYGEDLNSIPPRSATKASSSGLFSPPETDDLTPKSDSGTSANNLEAVTKKDRLHLIELDPSEQAISPNMTPRSPARTFRGLFNGSSPTKLRSAPISTSLIQSASPSPSKKRKASEDLDEQPTKTPRCSSGPEKRRATGDTNDRSLKRQRASAEPRPHEAGFWSPKPKIGTLFNSTSPFGSLNLDFNFFKRREQGRGGELSPPALTGSLANSSPTSKSAAKNQNPNPSHIVTLKLPADASSRIAAFQPQTGSSSSNSSCDQDTAAKANAFA